MLKTKHNLGLFCLFTTVFILVLPVQPVKSVPPYLGESSKDNRLSIVAYEFTTSSSIDYHPYTPSRSGDVFARVSLAIKNYGNETFYINDLFAYLKDTENNTYRSVAVSSPERMSLIKLEPLDVHYGEIYWEIPSDVTIAEFIWQDLESDLHIVVPEFSNLFVILSSAFLVAALSIIWKRKITN